MANTQAFRQAVNDSMASQTAWISDLVDDLNDLRTQLNAVIAEGSPTEVPALRTTK